MAFNLRAAVAPLVIAAPFFLVGSVLAADSVDELNAAGYPDACYEPGTNRSELARCVYEWRVFTGSRPVVGDFGLPISYGEGLGVRVVFGDMSALAVMAGMVAACAFFGGVWLGKGQ